jgi:hypothetical protein
MVNLWTPQGSTYIGEELVGYNGETSASIVIHTFQFHDPVTDRSVMVKIPADPGVSRDHVEDMAAQSLESFLLECKGFDDKKKPTPEQRKEIGRQIEEFRVYNSKRKESTNNKIYYKGM